MRRFRKSRRKVCATEESKAKALQVAWHSATDKAGTLKLSEARSIVADPPLCPYCQIKIPYQDISIDHVQPRSRGGSSDPENLVFCDRICNLAKGNLTGPEFTALMEFLSRYLIMRASLLQRLVSAGRMYRRYGRR